MKPRQTLMAPSVKVYGPPLSTEVSRVLACLHEKDVPYQLIPDHKIPEFRKIQPFGQVPAFQDGSINLFESRAICRYVCDKYASQGNKGLYGTNPLVKASIEQWIEAEGRSFDPPCSVLLFQLVFVPQTNVKPQDKNVIRQNLKKLSKVLDVYEKRLGESRYLAGDEFTLADLSHLPKGHFLVNRTDKGELFTARKNVARWWNEISTRKSWKKVVEMQKSTPPKS